MTLGYQPNGYISIHKALAGLDGVPEETSMKPDGISIHKALAGLDL